MADNGVMITPSRPLVIYESMSLTMKEVLFDKVSTEVDDVFMEMTGKRAKVAISFTLSSEKQIIGAGAKNLVIASLRPYDQDLCSIMVNEYLKKRDAYTLPKRSKIV